MAESAAAALDRLEGEGATGCLTVTTTQGAIRLFVVSGTPVHAEAEGMEPADAFSAAVFGRASATSFTAGPAYAGKWTLDPDAAPASGGPIEWPEEPEVPAAERVQLAFRNADANLGQALAVLGGLVILGIVFFLAIHSRG